MRSFKKSLLIFVVIVQCAFNPGVSQAKANEDQDQIIALNDTSAALEDTNPELSKSVALFADEREKEWEAKNANKDLLPIPLTDKRKMELKKQVKLLNEASVAMGPNYPLIAKSLKQMAMDIERTWENE